MGKYRSQGAVGPLNPPKRLLREGTQNKGITDPPYQVPCVPVLVRPPLVWSRYNQAKARDTPRMTFRPHFYRSPACPSPLPSLIEPLEYLLHHSPKVRDRDLLPRKELVYITRFH